MSNAAVSSSTQPSARLEGPRLFVALVLVTWFAVVVLLGATGAFATPAGTPPFPIALGVTVPIVAFLGALWVSRRFRDFVLTSAVRVGVAAQAWRFVGLGFLALYTYRILPASFALPAGLGDIAIGITAPWILANLIRQRNFAASKTFIVWNVLGLLDLVVAVGTGAASAALATGVAGEVTTAPMAQLPLVLVPAYFVPVFAMLHVAALMQARRLAADPAKSLQSVTPADPRQHGQSA